MDAVREVRLHTAPAGAVWWDDDSGRARVRSLDDALEDLHDVPSGVRVLGTDENAQMLTELYLGSQRPDGSFRVRLGSPAMLTAKRRNEPALVLHQLRQPDPPINHPGLWHDMREADYFSYTVTAWALRGNHRELPDLHKSHPAWLGVSFINDANHLSACRLLGTIVDPRWYAHPFHPGRLSRLFAYLGLNRHNMFALLSNASGDENFKRAAVAVSVWWNLDGESLVADAPGDFLWRTYAEDDSVNGLLNATRRMVLFLSTNWLGAVSSQGDSGFMPRYFFREENEWLAYEAHAKKKTV